MNTEELVQEFYSKPFFLSYSGLNKLLYSPSLFYRHYVLQQREEKIESYLIDGKVIHCILLDDGSFDEQFILTPKTLPTGNTRTIIDRVFNDYITDKQELASHGDEIIAQLKYINLHQSLKTDQQRLDKIITEESKSYWEFLKLKGNKTLIDEETLARCNQAVDALRADSTVCDLLGLHISEMDKIDIYNEHALAVPTDHPFGLKGIIDNIKIDHDKKIVYINDLKTTGKTIADFKETIEFYNYWAQAAMYHQLVYKHFDELLGLDWTIVFHFIVIDKYQQVYSFQVSAGTMLEWQIRLELKLKEAAWHYNKRVFNLPYQFAASKVIL